MKRVGAVVFVTYSGDFKNVVAGKMEPFMSDIPQGYKPINRAIIGERNAGNITIWFNSNGKTEAYNYGSAADIMNGQFSVCWITSDEYPS